MSNPDPDDNDMTREDNSRPIVDPQPVAPQPQPLPPAAWAAARSPAPRV